jgi:excinuclease UvrABC ATPase subunit
MSKYNPEEYQKNKESYRLRQQRYKSKNKDIINAKQAEYRLYNKDKASQYSKTRRNKIRDIYNEYMKDKTCEHCGYSDKRALVWHHINPALKKNGIIQLINKKHSWNTVLEEINKCICLCHNCHNIIHNHQSES